MEDLSCAPARDRNSGSGIFLPPSKGQPQSPTVCSVMMHVVDTSNSLPKSARNLEEVSSSKLPLDCIVGPLGHIYH